MRAAFLTDTYWPRVNGVTVSTAIFVKELRRLGHGVCLWAPDYPQAQGPRPDGCEVGVLRRPSLGLFFSKEDRLPNPFRKRAFYRQLDAFAPDLLHVQTEMASLSVRAYARRRQVPVVQTCHTYFEQYIAYYFPALPPRLLRAMARWLTRRLVRTADVLIAPTLAMKGILESYGIDKPIRVVPTGIAEEDFPRLDRAALRRESPWLDRFPSLRNKKLMLYVGRVAQEKNVDFLLDVAAQVVRDEPEAVLLVAGAGPYLETFQENARLRGLAGAVVCLGYVARKDLGELYALADVFTFASVTETQGLVTIEAMMCGTPVVAVGKMGTRELMGGDHGGYMVDEDPAAFAEAVLRLLEDPVLHRAKSDEALAFSRNWTAAAMALRVEDLYRSLLEGRQS